MIKYNRIRSTASMRAMAIHPAIFDNPTGYTSWEVMSRSSGETTRGAGTRFATRYLLFDFLASILALVLDGFFPSLNKNRGES